MKNIIQIFKNDLLRIHKNVIAMIVIMGITVIPTLYAWLIIPLGIGASDHEGKDHSGFCKGRNTGFEDQSQDHAAFEKCHVPSDAAYGQ